VNNIMNQVLIEGIPSSTCEACEADSAVVYCINDQVRLCLSCDEKLHSEHAFLRRHNRLWICETCYSEPAVFHCGVDAANLCKLCDVKVHSANRIAARHVRSELKPFLEDSSIQMLGCDADQLQRWVQDDTPSTLLGEMQNNDALCAEVISLLNNSSDSMSNDNIQVTTDGALEYFNCNDSTSNDLSSTHSRVCQPSKTESNQPSQSISAPASIGPSSGSSSRSYLNWFSSFSRKRPSNAENLDTHDFQGFKGRACPDTQTPEVPKRRSVVQLENSDASSENTAEFPETVSGPKLCTTQKQSDYRYNGQQQCIQDDECDNHETFSNIKDGIVKLQLKLNSSTFEESFNDSESHSEKPASQMSSNTSPSSVGEFKKDVCSINKCCFATHCNKPESSPIYRGGFAIPSQVIHVGEREAITREQRVLRYVAKRNLRKAPRFFSTV